MAQTKTNPRLGELVAQLLRALLQGHVSWSTQQAKRYLADRTGYSTSTVYRWIEGRSPLSKETLEELARLGKEEANLPRQWGEELLRAGSYPNANGLVDRLWGAKQIRKIPNNLPPSTYTTFVGRQIESNRLLELLSPRHAAHLITVDGIGGVGKTALVLEIAHHCLRASTGESPDPRVPEFDAIVFVSAKQEYLTPGGVLTRTHTQRTLRGIFGEVARALEREDINLATPEDQPEHVRNALARQDTLLIVDNLETMEDKQGIIEFLYDLPLQVKVVMTSRERVVVFAPIRLEQLPDEDGLRLIGHETHDKGLTLSDEGARLLYQRTGGVPAAMIYAVGQLAAGHSLEAVLARLAQPKGDVARFCFEGSVSLLRGQPAHALLMAMAMFPTSPVRKAVVHVAGLTSDPIAVEEGMVRLQQLSLVTQHENRCNVLPLTREYSSAELAAHPDFEHDARERWVGWYRDYTAKYGDRDWDDWALRFDHIEAEWSNLLVVFDWCASQDRYDDIKTFWRDRRVSSFSHIYGFWDDRLIWFEWLIYAAQRRGDWTTYVDVLGSKGWILSLMGQSERLREANEALEQAWQLKEHANPATRSELASDFAILRHRQKDFGDAMHWLDIAESLCNETILDANERARRWITILYWRGEICFHTSDLDGAAKQYEEMIKCSQAVGWGRAVAYAQNWLADIATAKGNLIEAERLLRTGLPIVERNKEKRRTAFYKRSFARLELARDNLDQARRWAAEALDGFDRLGMQPEAEEMRYLLESSEVSTRIPPVTQITSTNL